MVLLKKIVLKRKTRLPVFEKGPQRKSALTIQQRKLCKFVENAFYFFCRTKRIGGTGADFLILCSHFSYE